MALASKKKNQSVLGRSLAFWKFTWRHEAEINSFWYQKVASVYASRWINEHRSEMGLTLATFPGDVNTPFKNIDISPERFLEISNLQTSTVDHATIVRFVTVFENFLYDCIQRAVFLNPNIIIDETGKKNDFAVEASELSRAITGGGARAWFGHYVADKYCRGKTPAQLILRVDNLLKSGIGKRLQDDIDEWVRWTLVRNSVAHLGGDISRELAEKWPERFSTSSKRMELTYKDVLRVAYLSRKIGNQ